MSLFLSCDLEWQATLSLQTMGTVLTAFPLCDNARKQGLLSSKSYNAKKTNGEGR